MSEACPWTIEALATVRPDRHRPDIYDEASPYAHILDALRYGEVNNSRPQPHWTPPPPDKTLSSGMYGRLY